MNQASRWSPDQLKDYIDSGRQEIERQIYDARTQINNNTEKIGKLMLREEYVSNHEQLRRDLKEAQEGLRRDLERAQEGLRQRIEDLATIVSGLSGGNISRQVTWQFVVAAVMAAIAVVSSMIAFKDYVQTH